MNRPVTGPIAPERRLVSHAGVVVAALLLVGAGMPVPAAAPAQPQGQPAGSGAARPPGQRIAVGTGTIHGTVVAAATNRSVGNVRVSLARTATGGGDSLLGHRIDVGNPITVRFPRGVDAGVEVGLVPRGAGALQSLRPWRTVVTDAGGRFAFGRLPAGRYQVSVSHDAGGYLTAHWGEARPGGLPGSIVLAEGDAVDITIPLVRGGVITGQVAGEHGEPAVGLRVSALRLERPEGVPSFRQAATASTDDRGVFRLYGLEPGDYLVSAAPGGPPRYSWTALAQAAEDRAAVERALAAARVQPGSPEMGRSPYVEIPAVPSAERVSESAQPGFLPVYLPGVLRPADGVIVHVTGGDEHGPFDLNMPLVRGTSVFGTVAPPPAAGAPLSVSLHSADPLVDPQAVAVNGARFSFETVAPGRYTLFAYVPNDPRRSWAQTEIVVSGEPAMEVPLTLTPGRTISGTVVFDRERPGGPRAVSVGLMLERWPGSRATLLLRSPPQAAVGSDGRFTLTGVIPGQYVIRHSGGGYLQSVFVGGIDTLDVPLDVRDDRDLGGVVVTITDRATELRGTVTDARGSAVRDRTIVVAPSEEHFRIPGARRIQTTRTDADGHYSIRGTLPPGMYVVAAVEEFEDGQQYDREFLASAASGGRWVMLVAGTTAVQDLRVP